MVNQKTATHLTYWELGYDGIHKAIAYNHGRNMYGLNLDLRTERCRIILKAYTDGRAEICFINASSLERCFEVLEAFINTNSSTGVSWRADSYYKDS